MPRSSRALALAALLLAAAAARASKPRCRLERIDPAPLADDQLRLYASVVELEGVVVDGYGPAQFTLRVDGRAAGRAVAAQPFSLAREEVDVALVVEVAASYGPAFDRIRQALAELVDDPPRGMKVALFPFGSDIERRTPFQPAPSLAQPIDDLAPDEDSVEIRLADAVRLALTELKKLAPAEPGRAAPRRLIVLLSDGINVKMDRDTFRKLGAAARDAGVPIHSVAFSPIDERGPLLNLGELSKLTFGTFRWARSADDLKVQFQNLADEIRKQYVLTFKSPVSSTERHTFQLRCDNLVSNPLGDVRSRPIRFFGWSLLAVALALAAAAAALSLRRRRAVASVPSPGRAAPATASVPVPRVQAIAPAAASRVQPIAPVAAPRVQPITPAAAPRVQPIAPPSGRAPSASAAAGGRSATLIAIGGTLAGRRIPVAGAVTVGTGADNAVTVDDPTVSSRHAEIAPEGGGLVVRDLGSRNGTFVNNRRVSGSERLGDGDVVRFGGATQFKVRID